jgi:hypothetical protein
MNVLSPSTLFILFKVRHNDGKDVDATVWSLTKGIILEFDCGDSGKPDETWVRLDSVPAKIQNTYRYV